MNLKKIFQMLTVLCPTIGNCTDELNHELRKPISISRIDFKSHDKLQPISTSTKLFDYETADSSRQTVDNITMSPRFKTVCSSEKHVSENMGGGHVYLFSYFGLIDQNTVDDQRKIPILKIYANNKYKIKSFEGYVDRNIFTQSKDENSLMMLKKFILYHKLPSYYEKIINTLPRLQEIFKKNIYYSTLQYLADLEYVFDVLNLTSQTKSMHVAVCKKDKNSSLINSESTDKFLVSLKVDKIQDIIKRAQIHHHRSDDLINRFQRLLPDIIACNTLYNIIEMDEDLLKLEKRINREYPWIENFNKINDINRFKVIIANIYNIERSIEGSDYYDQTLRDLSNRIKLLPEKLSKSKNMNDHGKTLDNNDYDKSVFLIKSLFIRMIKEFSFQ